jgi:hypothetical protein
MCQRKHRRSTPSPTSGATFLIPPLLAAIGSVVDSLMCVHVFVLLLIVVLVGSDTVGDRCSVLNFCGSLQFGKFLTHFLPRPQISDEFNQYELYVMSVITLVLT